MSEIDPMTAIEMSEIDPMTAFGVMLLVLAFIFAVMRPIQ
jgi:hypothetical protein